MQSHLRSIYLLRNSSFSLGKQDISLHYGHIFLAICQKKSNGPYLNIFQASGVKVSEEVKNRFDEIKRKKNLRYLIFYIKDEKTICIEKAGEY